MNEVNDFLEYMQREHHFSEDEFVKMFSEDELVDLCSAVNPRQALDDFLQDNYYGRIRKNWFLRIQSGGEVADNDVAGQVAANFDKYRGEA